MNTEGSMISAIGNTPLLRLRRLFPDGGPEVHAKLELLNPGGSAKDRPALRMIQEAWHAGMIGPGSVLIESSSGNMAISLAMISRYLGMRFICVIDPRTTETNIRILKAMGAEIDYVADPDPVTGEFLPARLNRVRQLLKVLPGSYWPNQYTNADNYRSHYHTTMREMVERLGRIDYLFCAVSTCGTIRGCAEYARDHGLNTKIVAVDAEGSAIFGRPNGKRRFPGLGAGMVTPLYREELIDRVVHVSDWDMVKGCRALAQKESVLAGASSGAVVAAVMQLQKELDPGSVCAVIVHDRGDRYLDTVYSDAWIGREFGPELAEDALAGLEEGL
jgi:2,3-diaminopropionate biosynthesis protein SbnA